MILIRLILFFLVTYFYNYKIKKQLNKHVEYYNIKNTINEIIDEFYALTLDKMNDVRIYIEEVEGRINIQIKSDNEQKINTLVKLFIQKYKKKIDVPVYINDRQIP